MTGKYDNLREKYYGTPVAETSSIGGVGHKYDNLRTKYYNAPTITKSESGSPFDVQDEKGFWDFMDNVFKDAQAFMNVKDISLGIVGIGGSIARKGSELFGTAQPLQPGQWKDWAGNVRADSPQSYMDSIAASYYMAPDIEDLGKAIIDPYTSGAKFKQYAYEHPLMLAIDLATIGTAGGAILKTGLKGVLKSGAFGAVTAGTGEAEAVAKAEQLGRIAQFATSQRAPLHVGNLLIPRKYNPNLGLEVIQRSWEKVAPQAAQEIASIPSLWGRAIEQKVVDGLVGIWLAKGNYTTIKQLNVVRNIVKGVTVEDMDRVRLETRSIIPFMPKLEFVYDKVDRLWKPKVAEAEAAWDELMAKMVQEGVLHPKTPELIKAWYKIQSENEDALLRLGALTPEQVLESSVQRGALLNLRGNIATKQIESNVPIKRFQAWNNETKKFDNIPNPLDVYQDLQLLKNHPELYNVLNNGVGYTAPAYWPSQFAEDIIAEAARDATNRFMRTLNKSVQRRESLARKAALTVGQKGHPGFTQARTGSIFTHGLEETDVIKVMERHIKQANRFIAHGELLADTIGDFSANSRYAAKYPILFEQFENKFKLRKKPSFETWVNENAEELSVVYPEMFYQTGKGVMFRKLGTTPVSVTKLLPAGKKALTRELPEMSDELRRLSLDDLVDELRPESMSIEGMPKDIAGYPIRRKSKPILTAKEIRSLRNDPNTKMWIDKTDEMRRIFNNEWENARESLHGDMKAAKEKIIWPEGYRTYWEEGGFEESIKRLAYETKKYPKATKYDETAFIDKMVGVLSGDTEMVIAKGAGEIMPRRVLDHLKYHLAPTEPLLDLLFEDHKRFWAPFVLSFRTAWNVTNAVTNGILTTMAGNWGGLKYMRDPKLRSMLPAEIYGSTMNLREWGILDATKEGAGWTWNTQKFLREKLSPELAEKLIKFNQRIHGHPVLQAGRKIAEWQQWVDDTFKGINYFAEAEKQIRSLPKLIKTGKYMVEAMEELFGGRLEPGKTQSVRQIISKTSNAVYHWNALSIQERKVMTKVIPFSGWRLFTTGLLFRLPVEYPGRAYAIKLLGQMGRLYVEDLWKLNGVDPKTVPAWENFSIPLFVDENGKVLSIKPGFLKLYDTMDIQDIGEMPFTHPSIKFVMEQLLGLETYPKIAPLSRPPAEWGVEGPHRKNIFDSLGEAWFGATWNLADKLFHPHAQYGGGGLVRPEPVLIQGKKLPYSPVSTVSQFTTGLSFKALDSFDMMRKAHQSTSQREDGLFLSLDNALKDEAGQDRGRIRAFAEDYLDLTEILKDQIETMRTKTQDKGKRKELTTEYTRLVNRMRRVNMLLNWMQSNPNSTVPDKLIHPN